MKDLHVSVRDKVASYSERDGKVVCGNTDYQIVFTFDSEWDAYPEKTARFIWNGKYIDVPFTGNVCTMPMVYDTFTCLIGVYVKDFETTTSARIECLKSILCVDSVRDNESDKIYADEAKISANEAKESAETATNAAQQAGNFAVRAEQAAETAENAVTSAVNKLKIPTVTAEDNGKILTVVDGEWGKSNPPTELPEVSETDSGKVLTVKDGQWSAVDPEVSLPPVTDADNGNYLGVQNGQWKVMGQMEPDPDTLLPYVKQEDNGKVLSVVNGRWAAAEAPESGDGGVSSWNELTDKPFGDNADGTVKQIDNKYLAPIVFNSGYEEIRPEFIFTTVMNSDFGVYYNGVSVGQELYDRWQANTDKVRVTFDGTVYECTPQMVGGYYGVGNGVPFGGTGNNEPFVVTIAPDNGAYYLTCFCLTDTAPTRHSLTVELYEEGYKLREEYLPMDAIKTYIDDYISEALGGDY